MRLILLSRCSTARLSGFAFRLCCGSPGSKKIQVMRMAWIFLLDCSYWFARISRLYGIACIGSLVLFRQQHGAVLTIIDDVHLCCDQLFCLRNVCHLKLRLLRGVMYNLQTVLLAELKHLQVVFRLRHVVHCIPKKHLQVQRYFRIHASCQVSAF